MLYEITATYAKQIEPYGYFVFANNKREAKKIFLDRCPWLNVITDISESDLKQIEDRSKVIVFGCEHGPVQLELDYKE